MHRDDRDRFAESFKALVGLSNNPTSSDEDAALRLLSNALLNYLAAAHAPRGDALGRALPWLSALHAWTCRGWSTERVAHELVESQAARTLGASFLRARLDAPSRVVEATPHAGRAANTHPQRHARITELAALDARLRTLVALDARGRLNALFEDSTLAAASAGLCDHDPASPLPQLLAADSQGLLALAWRARFPTDRPLRMLAGLEDPEAHHPMLRFGFAARARGFERGLATNLVDLGLAPAIRAALLFGRGPHTDARALNDVLAASDVFRDDDALRQLAVTLATCRGCLIDHLRGWAPMASLQPWVDFLRDGCVALAESRAISLREATGYAHYALHLVDICDLLAEGSGACSEATRDALLHLEEEIREFALAGQRNTSSARQASLAAYELARWRRAGVLAELAGRLTRLRGAWRGGLQPGPLGAPPRLDAETTAHSQALVDAHFNDSNLLDAVVTALRHMRIHGFEWTATLPAESLLKCLIVAFTQARDLPNIDLTRPFDVDFGPVGAWLQAENGEHLNVLRRFLESVSVQQLLQSHDEPSLLQVGLVGQVDTTPGNSRPLVTFRFVATDEMRALLQLLSRTTDDPALHDLLRQRLDRLVASGTVVANTPKTTSEPTQKPVGTVLPNPEAQL